MSAGACGWLCHSPMHLCMASWLRLPDCLECPNHTLMHPNTDACPFFPNRCMSAWFIFPKSSNHRCSPVLCCCFNLTFFSHSPQQQNVLFKHHPPISVLHFLQPSLFPNIPFVSRPTQQSLLLLFPKPLSSFSCSMTIECLLQSHHSNQC